MECELHVITDVRDETTLEGYPTYGIQLDDGFYIGIGMPVEPPPKPGDLVVLLHQERFLIRSERLPSLLDMADELDRKREQHGR